MNRLSPIVIKSADASGSGEFEGYASTWQRDLHGDRIAPGAWAESIAAKQPVAMLWHHRHDEPVGAWLRFAEDEFGLHAEGKLTLSVQRAKEAHALMRDGAVGLSVGFNLDPADTSWDDATQSTVIHRATLIETSIVAVPSNRGARISEVKSFTTRPEFEKYFRELGFANRFARRLAAAAVSEPGIPACKSEPDDIDWDAIALQLAASPLLDIYR